MTSSKLLTSLRPAHMPKGNSEYTASKCRTGWSTCKQCLLLSRFAVDSEWICFPSSLLPRSSRCRGRPVPAVQPPTLSLDGSMLRERGHLAGRGSEDPVNLRRAGRGQWAGSWWQMWMGHIWGSGPAWRTTEPTHPLSGGAGPSLSPVLRAKRGTHLSWPVFTQ